jgi:hypothetical protein
MCIRVLVPKRRNVGNETIKDRIFNLEGVIYRFSFGIRIAAVAPRKLYVL